MIHVTWAHHFVLITINWTNCWAPRIFWSTSCTSLTTFAVRWSGTLLFSRPVARLIANVWTTISVFSKAGVWHLTTFMICIPLSASKIRTFTFRVLYLWAFAECV